MSTSQYIHGSAPEEQARLRLMNKVLNDAELREMNIARGERIVEFGSGLGEFARAMARAAEARVVCVERDPDQIAASLHLAGEAREGHLMEVRQGDVYAPPLADAEWESFDTAHARFVLEHVPEPLAVVRNMLRAVRPGGRVVLCDDDHDTLRLWPEPPGFWPVWHAYCRAYDRLGNDPYVGRRLVMLLDSAGAAAIRNTCVFFGACSGMPLFDTVVDNLVAILEGARESVLANQLLEPAATDAGIAAVREWKQQRGAAFWYALCWAEGRR